MIWWPASSMRTTHVVSSMQCARVRGILAIAPPGQDPRDRVRPRAAVNRKKRGVSRPDTFAFLGFTFICSKSHRGFFQLQRKTRRDRMQAKLQEIKAGLRLRMHQTMLAQGHWLMQVVTGHLAYYAVPTNSRSLSAF